MGDERRTTEDSAELVGGYLRFALAEREGFEPSNELPRYILSRDAPSTRLGHLSV